MYITTSYVLCRIRYKKVQINTSFVHLHILICVMKDAPPRVLVAQCAIWVAKTNKQNLWFPIYWCVRFLIPLYSCLSANFLYSNFMWGPCDEI